MTRRGAFCLLVILASASCMRQSAAVQPSQRPSPVEGPSVSLATIQRVDARSGFAASWTGSGPVLARTLDNGSSWQKIEAPVAHLTVLRFLDTELGWAVGFVPRAMPGVACQQAPPTATTPCYGAVLRTEDGGATWQKSLLIPYYGTYSEPVQQIQAFDGQTAWVLVLDCGGATAPIGTFGCPADIRKTTDGGRTWTTLTRGYIVAMRFATPTRGWSAVARADGSADVNVTDDGGATWATRLHTTLGQIVGLDAVNRTAWAMTRDGGYCSATTCEKYQLFATTDGGNSWASLGNPKASAGSNCERGQLAGPVFVSPAVGWLAENTGAGGARAVTGLLQTVDGGKTWRCLTQPSNTELVSAADPDHLWVMSQRAADGASEIFSTDDGGSSWRSVSVAGLA